MKKWWVRWYGLPEDSFNYTGPWWCTGYAMTDVVDADDVPIFVAAVMAESEDAARKVIEAAYDDGEAGVREWSFTDQRADNWEPWTDRFPREDWMQWPTTTQENSKVRAENT